LKIESYVERVLADLPMEHDLKEELREEFTQHLHEHVSELMIKGYSEKEAVFAAIRAFGDERQLNWEFKKTVLPFKIIRYLVNVIFVTAFFCLLSYFTMEYYFPKADNTPPLYSIIGCFVIVFCITGSVEFLYETVVESFKSNILTNPWLFFLIPSLFIGLLTFTPYFENPDDYKYGLWLDLLVIPIGAVLYVTFRQLFNLMFLNKRVK
jgi:hypothetical protein